MISAASAFSLVPKMFPSNVDSPRLRTSEYAPTQLAPTITTTTMLNSDDSSVKYSTPQYVLRSRSMSASSRQALLELEFLIIGAGLAGLSTAYALARSGHHVRVLDRYPSLDDYPSVGGIRLPPNATKILVEWGFEDDLETLALPVRGSTLYSLATGDILGYMGWQEAVMKESGGKYLLMHHATLHRLLHDRCKSLGVRIDFGSKVTAVTPGLSDQESPSAMLESGEVLEADIIIGADGPQSSVRSVVLERPDDAQKAGMSVLTGTIPAEALRSDEKLMELMEAVKGGADWPIFMGPRHGILSYPVNLHGQDAYNVHLFWPEDELPPMEDENETWDHEFPTSLIDLQNYCPLALKIVQLLPSLVRVPQVTRKVDEWVDATSRIVLIGEAAHTLLPAGSYSTSMSIEDAAVLGTLFARLRSWDQVGWMTEAYQELRQKRVEFVRQAERTDVDMVQMPQGPAQEARDAYLLAQYSLGRDPSQFTEEMLRDQWQGIASVFGYNAVEEAEDWWVNWGVLRERAQNRVAHDNVEVHKEVVGMVAEGMLVSVM